MCQLQTYQTYQYCENSYYYILHNMTTLFAATGISKIKISFFL